MVHSIHTAQGFLEFKARVKAFKMVIRLKHLSDQVLKVQASQSKMNKFFLHQSFDLLHELQLMSFQ